MGHLKKVIPFALVFAVGCGSRSGDDDVPPSSTGAPQVPCDSDADCESDQICLYGSCATLAPESTGDVPTSTDYPAPTAPTTPGPDTSAPDVYGVWYGYVEGFEFASGSDVLRLELVEGDCSPSATLTLGEGEPPPPATDGSIGYPEATTDLNRMGLNYSWYEGYEYAATDVELSPLRIQMKVEFGQLWEGWCELQTSYESDGYYSCLPNWGGAYTEGQCYQVSPDGETYERDCGQLSLCLSQTCDCTAQGCSAGSGQVTQLDVAIEDGHLEGLLTGFGTVRFYR